MTGTGAVTFDTTGALLLDTSRASLQVATRLALTGTDARIVRPYSGYTSELRYRSRFDGNGCCVTFDTTDALPLDTSRASLQVATRLALTGTDARIVRPYFKFAE